AGPSSCSASRTASATRSQDLPLRTCERAGQTGERYSAGGNFGLVFTVAGAAAFNLVGSILSGIEVDRRISA
ncbi:MAG: hypothetical protein ACYCST_00005, partial [Acidimicrobiales bacterium]